MTRILQRTTTDPIDLTLAGASGVHLTVSYAPGVMGMVVVDGPADWLDRVAEHDTPGGWLIEFPPAPAGPSSSRSRGGSRVSVSNVTAGGDVNVSGGDLVVSGGRRVPPVSVTVVLPEGSTLRLESRRSS
ncbi:MULTISPECIES: hypothetical protein [unclassified Nocardiopsis]|uniref:hypothetical protein n=1 Tax=Nocardiopsis TaxID=2013 RepID=UPI00387AE224